jgi:dihydrofolate synthase/folylpolyglutamate synthase
MGSPRPAHSVITVAGTNGKGSTVAYLSAMLSGLGKRVGVYSTPHLLRYNERIRIGDTVASDQQIIEAFMVVENLRGDISLTYFEFGTLAALYIFSQSELDYAVLEVGLGGRLDAVNLVDCDTAVITPVGLDHQAYLGDDRDSIGFEKAGIIRSRIPVICGEQEPPRTVLEVAARLEARILRPGLEFLLEPEGNTSRYSFEGYHCELPVTVMEGGHQQMNMAAALTALLVTEPESPGHLQTLSESATRVVLPGRLEILAKCPTVIVDVGHNELASKVVAEFLSDLRAKNNGGSASATTSQVRCVLGMLTDKDAEAVARQLAAFIDVWYCAGLAGPRGQSGKALAGRVKDSITSEVRAFQTVSHALETVLDDALDGDTVLVFGSFETAGQAVAYFRERSGQKRDDAARIPA